MKHGARKNTVKAICKIDNKELRCEVVDFYYNDHAKEVRILEGVNAGRLTIVENYDITSIELPKTLSSLVKFVSNDIENKEDLQDDLFVELVSCDTMEVVKEFSKGVQLSRKDFDILTSTYGVYNYCKSIEEVKFYLLVDVVSELLDGNKTSYTSFKKQQIKKSL